MNTSLEDQTKVWNLIKDIRIAMFVTQDSDGALSARPMSAVNSEFNGSLWFMTSATSPKIDEIEGAPNVLVAYSEPKNQNYVSVRGAASIVRDKAKIKEFWSEAARVWFPKGPDDANIALIRVDVESAEYWDTPNATMVYVYGYAKARLTGEPPDIGENKTVKF